MSSSSDQVPGEQPAASRRARLLRGLTARRDRFIRNPGIVCVGGLCAQALYHDAWDTDLETSASESPGRDRQRNRR